MTLIVLPAISTQSLRPKCPMQRLWLCDDYNTGATKNTNVQDREPTHERKSSKRNVFRNTIQVFHPVSKKIKVKIKKMCDKTFFFF